MGSRAYIAKFTPDGSGQLIYLGHGCYPDDVGLVLLHNYQDEAAIDRIIAMGSMNTIEATPEASISYHANHGQSWEHCQPVAISGGTDSFFSKPYDIGPEWLYAWTPDGWFAAPVHREMPADYFDKMGAMSMPEFQHWFENNQQANWTKWRADVAITQRPQPLHTVIESYCNEAVTSSNNLSPGPEL